MPSCIVALSPATTLIFVKGELDYSRVGTEIRNFTSIGGQHLALAERKP
jgi:hypothetical protein